MTYFEDFTVGQVFEHHRGRSITEFDNTRWTLDTLNSAQSHWNRELTPTGRDGTPAAGPIINGALVLALAVGLTSQDVSSRSLGDVGLDSVRFVSPVFPGDTLYARSEIVALDEGPDPNEGGVVTYRIECTNQHDALVLEAVRIVGIKKAAAWRERDAAYTDRVFTASQPN
jgi:acyl dehydratase